MRIPRAVYDEMVEHARADAPNECCGIIGSRDGEAVRLYRTANAFASPFRYEIDGKDLLRVYNDISDRGLDLGIIYHSHTRSAPYPSQTDINLATWPSALYVIVGVAEAEAQVRAYEIRDGQVTESELHVE
jgi:proteasome lid subunit RPN8/RPN11